MGNLEAGDPGPEPGTRTIRMEKTIFSDHMSFWRQLVGLDQSQRMILWASIQRQAYREIGLDYAWDTTDPVPLLPLKEVGEAQDTTITTPDTGGAGHYL